MAEILVKAFDTTHPDPIKDEQGCYKRGYPVTVMPDDHQWGAAEGPPNFYLIKIPGIELEEITDYLKPHRRILDFIIDGQNMQVSTQNPTVNGRGVLTQDILQEHADEWNLSIIDVGVNGATLVADPVQAVKSKGFWKDKLDLLTFSGEVFDNGVCSLNVDYQSIVTDKLAKSDPNAILSDVEVAVDKQVEDSILSKSAIIDNKDLQSKQIIIQIAETDAHAIIQQNIKEKLETVISRRQFYFNSDFMNLVEKNDGVLKIDLKTIQANINNKIND